MSGRRGLLVGLAIAFLVASPAVGPGRAYAQPSDTARGGDRDGETTLEAIAAAVFTELERQIIRDYYRDHGHGRSGLPPGLARRDRLPPGLERQLVERGRLPPGLETRALPDDLVRRLPRRDARYGRVEIDGGVLLIENATRLVLDVIRYGVN